MARRRHTNKANLTLHVIQPNAAGIDVGADQIHIAVPPGRDPQPVRCFPTFTANLFAAAAWLKSCRIETVAMESTGVYWIPFFQILEELVACRKETISMGAVSNMTCPSDLSPLR